MTSQVRGSRRTAVGIVTSDKMNKTRRVELPFLVKHPRYGKYIKRRTICYVHDEKNESSIGDSVEIIESRPKSRLKRWDLVRIVDKNREVDVAAMKAASQLAAEQAKAIADKALADKAAIDKAKATADRAKALAEKS